MTEPRRIDDDDYQAAIDELAARLRFQVEFAQSALRSLLLVNGGAIVALLTLIGNSSANFDERSIWWAFFWFGTGLSIVLLAYFGAFLSQFFFMEVTANEAWNAQLRREDQTEKYDLQIPNKKGNCAFVSGAICALVGLGSFVIGAFVALGGIL